MARQRTDEAQDTGYKVDDLLASSPEEAERLGVTDRDPLEATEYCRTPRGQKPNGLNRSAVVLAKQGRGLTMMMIDNWLPIPSLAASPVALLLDDATASSDEGVAVAFAGRALTRSFGTHTYC